MNGAFGAGGSKLLHLEWAMGLYCATQGTVCDWVNLLYSRDGRNIVNQNCNLIKSSLKKHLCQ